MSDNLTAAQRRKNMQAIRSQDTSIELTLRKALWQAGLRYRKNVPSITGKPDIAIKKYKIAIFCDSDFWHGFDWETAKLKIKSNHEYWLPKIERNMRRDEKVTEALQSEGWTVIRFWEHEIRKSLPSCVEEILSLIADKKRGLADGLRGHNNGL